MIAVIDYGVGNLKSIANALSFLGASFVVSRSKEEIRRADKLILPGVGAFAAGMQNLRSFGLDHLLNEEVMVNKKSILGICLGMQLFAEKSFEDGEHQGLGWIKGVNKKIPADAGLKVPHMGWDEIFLQDPGNLLSGIADRSVFYFVHSYYLECAPAFASSFVQYGVKIPATIEYRNIFGTQFHPEKSQDSGLRLLKNFIELKDIQYAKEPVHSLPFNA